MAHHATVTAALDKFGVKCSSSYYELCERFFGRSFSRVLNIFDLIHQRMFEDGGALLYRFREHAEHELEGGEIIAAVALSAPDGVRGLMLQHADDEKRHHRMFKAMVDHVAKDLDFETINIGYRNPSEVIASFSRPDGWRQLVLSIHWAEARNLFILRSYQTHLRHTEWSFRRLLEAQIAQVLADEERHVAYTAEIVDEMISNPALLEFASSYAKYYERGCWEEIEGLSAYFSSHERVTVGE